MRKRILTILLLCSFIATVIIVPYLFSTASGLEDQTSSEFFISFDDNGGILDDEAAVPISVNTNDNILEKVFHIGGHKIADNTNYVLGGWYLNESNGTLLTDTHVIEGDITLYAKWIVSTSHQVNVEINSDSVYKINVNVPEESSFYHGKPLLIFIEEYVEVQFINNRFQDYVWSFRKTDGNDAQFTVITESTRMPEYDISIELTAIQTHRQITARVLYSDCVLDFTDKINEENLQTIDDFFDYVQIDEDNFYELELQLKNIVKVSIHESAENLFDLVITNDLDITNNDDVIITIVIRLAPEQQTFTVTIDLNATGITGITGNAMAFTVDFGTSGSRLEELLGERNIESISHDLIGWAGVPLRVADDITVKVQWSIKTFIVTIDLNDYGIIGATGDTTVLAVDFGTTAERLREILSDREITSVSHELTGWYGSLIITENTTVFAQWTIKTFTVSIDLNKDAVTSVVTGNASVLIVNYGKTNYRLEESLNERNIRSVSHELTEWAGIPEIVTEDIVVIAQWTIKTVKVTIDLNDVGITDITGNKTALAIDFGTTAEQLRELLDAKNITSSSHELTNWLGIPVIVTENITVSAQWTIKTLTVTINLNAATIIDITGNVEPLIVDWNVTSDQLKEMLNARNITSASHELTGWSNIPETLTEDITVIVQWRIRTFTVSIDLNGSGITGITISSQTIFTNIPFGTDVSTFVSHITITSESHQFKGFDHVDMVTDYTIITAVWGEVFTFDLTFDFGTEAINVNLADIEFISIDFGFPAELMLEFLAYIIPTSDNLLFSGWLFEGIVSATNTQITAVWGVLRTFTVEIDLNDSAVTNASYTQLLFENVEFGTNALAAVSSHGITSDSHPFVGFIDTPVTITGNLRLIVQWGEMFVFDLTVNSGTEATDVVTGVNSQLNAIPFGTTADQILSLLEAINPTSANLLFEKWFFEGNVNSNNKEVTIIWGDVKTFMVTINLNEGQVVDGEAVIGAVLTGEDLTLNLPFGTNLVERFMQLVPTSESHVFANWLGLTSSLAANKEVEAKWGMLSTFTITIDLNEDNVTNITGNAVSLVVQFGTTSDQLKEMLDARNIRSSSHFFTGWTGVPETVIENITVIAQWTIRTFTVTIDLNVGEITEVLGDTSVLTVDFGTTAAQLREMLDAKEIRSSSHQLTEWTGIPVVVVENSTVIAQWRIKTFIVEIDLNEDGVLSILGNAVALVVEFGTTYDQLNEMLNSRNIRSISHEFTGWMGIPEKVTEDIVVIVQWTIRTFAVTIDLNASEIPEVLGDTTVLTVGYGTTAAQLREMLAAREITSSSHELIGWTEIPTTVIENITVVAQWTIKTFTITINLNEDGITNISYTQLIFENVLFATNVLTAVMGHGIVSDSHPFVGFIDAPETIIENLDLLVLWGEIFTFDLTINSGTEAMNVITGVTTQLNEIPFGTNSTEVLSLLEGITPTSSNLLFEAWLFEGNVSSNNTKVTIQWQVASDHFAIEFDTKTDLLSIPTMYQIPIGATILDVIEAFRQITRPGYVFLGWSLDGQLLREDQQMPAENILLEANWSEESTIFIDSDIAIFNGENHLELTQLANVLNVRELLLELRNAMNSLNENTDRVFNGIAFALTPGHELVGFSLDSSRSVNVLHTNEILIFGAENHLTLYAIVRSYTHKNDLIFTELDDETVAITGASWQMGQGGDIDILVLPSFFNGKKVVSIGNGAFSSRNIREIFLPVYVKNIGSDSFRHNNTFRILHLTGLPHLETIGAHAFGNAAGSIGLTERRHVYIDAITLLSELHESALRDTTRIDVHMTGTWDSSQPPLWWPVRDRFNSQEMFFADDSTSMINFFD